MTHAALIRSLNAICHSGNRAVRPLKARVAVANAAGDTAVTARQLERVDRVYARALGQLAAISPSAQDAPTFGRYVQSVRRSAGLTRRMVAALRANDTAIVDILAGLGERERKRRVTAAIDLGADACGR